MLYCFISHDSHWPSIIIALFEYVLIVNNDHFDSFYQNDFRQNSKDDLILNLKPETRTNWELSREIITYSIPIGSFQSLAKIMTSFYML